MKNKIQEILNEDINVHIQYDDPNPRNSVRKINGICFILGNSVGLAIYESFYERLGKVCKDYKCILLGEDDDYWFIRNEINYIHGEDEFQKIQLSYLKGASGYLLVMDGTRLQSIEVARKLHDLVKTNLGHIPHRVIINKADLVSQWCFSKEVIDEIKQEFGTPLITSAKTGVGVESNFRELAMEMIK